MKKTETKKIFISYREQDTAGETGRLADALQKHFSKDQIFLDINTLEPGADFSEAIDKSLDDCDVFLAVIGPRWMGEGNNKRIQNPDDWVRREVSTALARNIRVVPVLVDGGKLPKTEDLPTDLHPLLRRQSLEITNKRWQYDTDNLIHFLIHTAGIQPKRSGTHSSSPAESAPKSRTWLYAGTGFGLAMLVLVVLAVMQPQKKQDPPNPIPPHRNDSIDSTKKLPPNRDGLPTDLALFSGSWKELDEGETSTFHLIPNGNSMDVQVELLGELVGSGTGSMQNGQLELNFSLLGFPTVLRASLSEDGNTLFGTYFMQSTGMQQPVRMVRLSTHKD